MTRFLTILIVLQSVLLADGFTPCADRSCSIVSEIGSASPSESTVESTCCCDAEAWCCCGDSESPTAMPPTVSAEGHRFSFAPDSTWATKLLARRDPESPPASRPSTNLEAGAARAYGFSLLILFCIFRT